MSLFRGPLTDGPGKKSGSRKKKKSHHGHKHYKGSSKTSNCKKSGSGKKKKPPVKVTEQATLEALNKALGRPICCTEPFTRRKLKSITTLDLSGASPQDFSVLQYTPNLTYLDISETHAHNCDLIYVGNLLKLEVLLAKKINIADISPLSNLINLSYLEISVNRIFDISYLENLDAAIYAFNHNVNLGKLTPQCDDTFMLDLDFLKDLHGDTPCIDFISNNGSCYEGESCDCSTIAWEDIDVPTEVYFEFSDDNIFSGVVHVTLVPNSL